MAIFVLYGILYYFAIILAIISWGYIVLASVRESPSPVRSLSV